jgi:hypothetical protein
MVLDHKFCDFVVILVIADHMNSCAAKVVDLVKVCSFRKELFEHF